MREEGPGVDQVVGCLATGIRAEGGGTGLVRILATLRPILTYKYKDPK